MLTGTRDSEISAQIEGLKLNGDITFVESPGDEGLADLYRGAVGLVFPSLYEGFGLPPLEAMACGVPVLTSNVCSLPEVVGDAAVLVNPLEVEAIADGIRRLTEDEAMRGKLRNKGLERIRQFSWDETARKTWDVLQAAAGRQSGAGTGLEAKTMNAAYSTSHQSVKSLKSNSLEGISVVKVRSQW